MQTEILAEQSHIDRCYERLEALRTRALELEKRTLRQTASGTHQDRYQRDVMAGVAARRASDLDIGSLPLVFGRLDTTDGNTYYLGRVAVYDENYEPLVV